MAKRSFDHEILRVVHVDAAGAVLGVTEHSDARTDRVGYCLRQLAADALRLDAHAILLAHNHPRGDPTPSRADIVATRSIVRALAPLGIRVHDHVVKWRGRDFSFRAAGLL